MDDTMSRDSWKFCSMCCAVRWMSGSGEENPADTIRYRVEWTYADFASMSLPRHQRPARDCPGCGLRGHYDESPMSENDKATLLATTSEDEWNRTVSEIVNRRGGYPPDWWDVVTVGKLKSRTRITNGW